MGPIFRHYSQCSESGSYKLDAELSLDTINYLCYLLIHAGLKYVVLYTNSHFLDNANHLCKVVSNLNVHQRAQLPKLGLARALLHRYVHESWSAVAPLFSLIMLLHAWLHVWLLYCTISPDTFLGAFWWHLMGHSVLLTWFVTKEMWSRISLLCEQLDNVRSPPPRITITITIRVRYCMGCF